MGTPVKFLSLELTEEVVDLYRSGLSYRKISERLYSQGQEYGPAIIARTIKEVAPDLVRRGVRPKLKDDEARIKDLYKSGLSVNWIAENEGVSFDTIKLLLGDDFIAYQFKNGKKIDCPDEFKFKEMAGSPEYGLKDISDYFNVSLPVVLRWMEELDVENIKKVHPIKINQEAYDYLTNYEWMLEKYNELGTVGIAELLGVVDGTVGRYLEKHGINRDKAFSHNTSQAEIEIAEFIKAHGFKIIPNSRQIISPKELDIFVPERNLAVEFNGLRWHSYNLKGSTYHYDKWRDCKEKGIQLIQIWEDEWEFSKERIESMLLHKLGASNLPRIGARECKVNLVDSNEARKFFDRYHIQGANPFSSIRIGLYCGSQLIACMSLNKYGDGYILARFATSLVVRGGFTKLLNFFETNYEPDFIVTFADLCVSDGSLYESSGFKLDKIIPPDYKYIVGKHREHKFNFRKKRFKEDSQLVYEEGLTERELAELNGIQRIYDAGKIRYVKYPIYDIGIRIKGEKNGERKG